MKMFKLYIEKKNNKKDSLNTQIRLCNHGFMDLKDPDSKGLSEVSHVL